MILETTQALIKLLRENIEQNTTLSAGAITEISTLPAIVLTGPSLTEKKRLMRDPERITAIDYEAGVAAREIPPRWYDLRFDVSVACESNLGLLELIEKFSRLNQSHITLTAKNADRERVYTWAWNLMASSDVFPNVSQVFQCKGEIIVYDVEIYSNIREEYSLITEINTEVKIQHE